MARQTHAHGKADSPSTRRRVKSRMGKTLQSFGRQKAKHYVACPRWNANAIEYVATTGADLLRGRGNWGLKES